MCIYRVYTKRYIYAYRTTYSWYTALFVILSIYTTYMKTHHFSLEETFNFAFKKTKKNIWFLLCAMVIAGVIMSALHRAELLGIIVWFVIGIIATTISLTIAHESTPSFTDVSKSFKNYKITLHFFLANLLYGIIVSIGILLFVLPGIYMAIRLGLYKFFIVEHEHMGPIQALKESMHITKGHFWKLLGFTSILVLINFIGLAIFAIGLLVTIPFSVIAVAHVYRQLTTDTQHALHSA